MLRNVERWVWVEEEIRTEPCGRRDGNNHYLRVPFALVGGLIGYGFHRRKRAAVAAA